MPNPAEVVRWPTPTVSRGDYTYDSGDHSKPRDTLSGAAKRLPTPKGSPGHYGRPRDNDRGDLQAAVMYPTPTSRDHKDNGPNTDYGKVAAKSKLAGVVMLGLPHSTSSGPDHREAPWRTPDSYPRGGAVAPDKRKEGGHSVNLQDQAGGQLNPTWVEWLMAVPLGWTGLEPLSIEEYNHWLSGDDWWTEPDVPRVVLGMPERVSRLKALGNGIVPFCIGGFLGRVT